jgi:hypothetical protein
MAQLIAQLLSGSSLAGARSSLTLLLLGLAGRMGWLPQFEDTWFASNVGLALLLGVTVIEEFVEQDEDMQSVMAAINYGIRGTGGALTAYALQQTGGEELPPWVAAALGAGVAVATHDLRMRLHHTLHGVGDNMLSPRTWLNWLELGGVVGVCAAIVFAPMIALGFIVLATVAGALALIVRRIADKSLNYRDCPACQKSARVEAWRCPHCRQNIPIERWLGQQTQAPSPAAPRPGPVPGQSY